MLNQANASKQCKVYVTQEMTDWVQKSPPEHPNRLVAANSGYITPDKINRLKKLGKLK